MFKHPLILPALVVTLAGGCNMAPLYTRPDAPVPATLPSGPAYAQATGSATVADLPWEEFLVDVRLQKLIQIALMNNRDLRIAALNAVRARAFYGVQRSSLLPTLNANATGAAQRLPADLSGNGKSMTLEQYSVNLGVAAWELDLFGRIRGLETAALEQYLATEQGRRGVQIVLVSGVANVYMILAADRQQLKIAETTLTAQRESFDMVKRRFDRGLVPELDVHRARIQVDSARLDVARYTQEVAQDENALRLLLGSSVPNELLPDDLDHVTPPREVVADVSSDVLLRRPDIIQAEHLLRAANANIGAARAAFFPRISLTAAVGTASSDLTGLFKSGSGAWSFAPQIAMPVFDARTWSAAEVSEADKKLAVAQYEKTIQTSFKEVADALAVRGTADRQIAAQESLVAASSETYRLSNVRYLRGIDNYLSVLDAQRSLYAAQRQLVTLRLAKLINQVALYAALGGGAEEKSEPALATAPATRRNE